MKDNQMTKTIKGIAAPLPLANVDTDVIMPKRFLITITREGLGDGAFADLRFDNAGRQRPEFILNKPTWTQANILIVGDNFGCGSSREHAPQALMRWGIRAVVGVSFAEIFFGNCLALGIPCASASPDQILAIQALVNDDATRHWTLDLEEMALASDQDRWDVTIDAGPRDMLRSGRWDATSQLLNNSSKVEDLMNRLPYLNNFATR